VKNQDVMQKIIFFPILGVVPDSCCVKSTKSHLQ